MKEQAQLAGTQPGIELKKRKAIKIEELPPKEMIVYKSFTYSRLNGMYEKKQGKRDCIFCNKEASVMVYFQLHKAQVMEKYCPECLDKYVILPNPSSPNPNQ